MQSSKCDILSSSPPSCCPHAHGQQCATDLFIFFHGKLFTNIQLNNFAGTLSYWGVLGDMVLVVDTSTLCTQGQRVWSIVITAHELMMISFSNLTMPIITRCIMPMWLLHLSSKGQLVHQCYCHVLVLRLKKKYCSSLKSFASVP